MIFIGFTGHTNIEKANDKKLINNGIEYDKETFNIVKCELTKCVSKLKLEKNIKEYGIVSGMARGVDEVVAFMAIEYDIPLILSIPNSISWHKNRSFSRGVKAQAINYNEILNYIEERRKKGCKFSKINEIKKHYLGKTYKYANEARNQNIIDASDYIISYLKYPSAGTLDGIKKAKKYNKYYMNITDLDL